LTVFFYTILRYFRREPASFSTSSHLLNFSESYITAYEASNPNIYLFIYLL